MKSCCTVIDGDMKYTHITQNQNQIDITIIYECRRANLQAKYIAQDSDFQISYSSICSPHFTI